MSKCNLCGKEHKLFCACSGILVDTFDKYKDNLEHNNIIGLMVKLIAVGLTTDRWQSLSPDDALYINHLLDGLRK